MSLYSIDSNGNQVLILSKILLNKLPQNFRVDGTLNCSGSSITELPDGLIVKNDLILTNSNIKKIPADILVCGRLYYNDPDLEIPETATVCKGCCFNQKLTRMPIFYAGYAETEKYIVYQDKIIPYTHKFTDEKEKYTYYRGAFKDFNFVNYNNLFYDACKDLKEARYKVMRWSALDRGVAAYNNLNLNSIIPLEDAIKLYEEFTGACEEGCHNWCEKYLPEHIKETQQTSILELIELTRGFYFNGSNLIEEYFTNGHQFVF